MDCAEAVVRAEGNISSDAMASHLRAPGVEDRIALLHYEDTATFEISNCPRPAPTCTFGYARRAEEAREANGVREVGSGHSTGEVG